MICSACGSSMAQDARFCPRCGAHFVAAPAAGPYAPMPYSLPRDRVARNLQTLGALWLVYAALRALTGVVGALILHGLFGSHFDHSDFTLGWSPFGRMWMDSLWPMAWFSVIVSVSCTVLTGYALLTRQPWGRVLAIIFAILALIHLPLGTALGIYTLWVLAPRNSGDEYRDLAYRQHGV